MGDRYREMLDMADRHFAEAQKRFPQHMECKVGCTGCCHGLFEIGSADVAMIAEGIRKLDRVTRTKLVERANAALALAPPTDLRECSPTEKERFFKKTGETPCPALDDEGRCIIYEHRPIVCRTFGIPLVDGRRYLGHVCDLNFTKASAKEKREASWNLDWEDVLGPEDEYTVPEAIILGAMLRK